MKQRRHARLAMLLAAGLLAGAGCSQQQSIRQGPAGRQALPFSVVSSGDSRTDIRSAKTFAWAVSQPLQQAAPRSTPGGAQLDALLQEAIVRTLQGKGYRHVASPSEGDLLVSYRVAMDDAGAGRGLGKAYGVEPSLNIDSPDPDRYEKGTLVIEVTDRPSGFTAWRSALQGFTDTGLGEAERRQRIELMVERMLAGIPAK